MPRVDGRRRSVAELLADPQVEYRPSSLLLANVLEGCRLDRPLIPLLNELNARGTQTDMSCAGHAGEPLFPYIAVTTRNLAALADLTALAATLPGAIVDISHEDVAPAGRLDLGLYWSGGPPQGLSVRTWFGSEPWLAELDAALPRALEALRAATSPSALSAQELSLMEAVSGAMSSCADQGPVRYMLHDHLDPSHCCPDEHRWTLDLQCGDRRCSVVGDDDFADFSDRVRSALVAFCPHR